VKIFSIILSKLANGWFRQRGDVFGFGNFDQGNPKLLINLDPIRLENAPINNMAAERQVNCINYKIKIRGSKGFECASSSNVKAQSSDLVGFNSDVLKTIERYLLKQMILLRAGRSLKQNQLVREGISKKECKNIKIDKRRNEDLCHLKDFGGSFVVDAEVNQYVAQRDVNLQQKVTRLYHKVRYARDSCLSILKCSDIFRLKRS